MHADSVSDTPHPKPTPATATARAGLVGGLGPDSTVDYYRRLVAAWAQRYPESAPPLMIDSLDPQQAIRLMSTDRAAMADYILASVKRLEAAGVDFAAITANTPHVVFDEVAARCSIPLISIVETCADAAVSRGFKRCGLLGTRFTMEASMYPDAFAKRGVELVVPDSSDRDWIHERYVGELLRGEFRDETRAEFIAFIERMRDASSLDAIILGGTELPVLLRMPVIADLPVLDTTDLHVEAIVERLSALFTVR